jgi:hypothetical protein
MSDVATWVGSVAGVLALGGVVVGVRAYRLQRTQAQAETKAWEREQADKEREQADKEREQADKEREQADKIDVQTSSTTREQTVVLKDHGNPLEGLHMVTIRNRSSRPIRYLSARLDVVDHEGPKGYLLNDFTRTGRVKPVVYGTPGQGSNSRQFTFENLWDKKRLLRAGDAAAFVWDIPSYKSIDLQFWVRFTDDKGLHWQIDTNLHLKKLDDRDW